MSSIRCSKRWFALFALPLVLAAVGPAVAFSVDATGVPTESEVGEEVSVTYTIDAPFTDVPNEWTLGAATELVNVSWTITVEQAGSTVRQVTYGNQSIEESFDLDNNGDRIEIALVGEAPPIDAYSYAPPQAYLLADLDRTTGNNTQPINTTTVHHYTAESAAARTAIEDAEAAIDEFGGYDDAESRLEDAIAFYESEEFDRAESSAADARTRIQEARNARQTRNTILTLVLIVLVLGAVGGGAYYWQSQQQNTGKL